MKKLLGLAFVLLGFAASSHAATILNVQVSSNALPGAIVVGNVTSLGQSQVATGTTNAFGRATLTFNIAITTAAPFQPAAYVVKGQGTDGVNFLMGRTKATFQIITSTLNTVIPVGLVLQ